MAAALRRRRRGAPSDRGADEGAPGDHQSLRRAAPGSGRRDSAGAGLRQPAGERRAAYAARHGGRDRRGGAAGRGGGERRRSRPRHPGGRGRAGVREVPPAGKLTRAGCRAGAHDLPRHRDGPWRPDLGGGAARGRHALPVHHSDHRQSAYAGTRGSGRARGGAVSGDRAAGPLVLLIEDEPQMRRFLRTALSANDYRLVEAPTAREGLAQAAGRSPGVVLLDLGLPDRDGLDVARELRGWSAVPIIVLSARGREQDKVAALDLGADDYLTKPFGVDELLARIRVALRHAARAPGAPPDPVFEAEGIRVDLVRREVRRGEQEVHLTPTEYKLLTVLIRHAGKVLTHGQLLKEVWGSHSPEQSHYVRVYMAQLRQKLEADPAQPRLLVTESGVGYRLRET